MKQIRHGRRTGGFTFMELLIVIAVVGILLAVVLPAFRPAKARPSRLNCTNQLKQVGLSFHQWALDHNDKFPMASSVTNGGTMELIASARVFPHFQVMSNDLNTPKLLTCMTDTKRVAATSFSPGLSDTNLSYFVGVDAEDAHPQMFLAGDRNITNHLGLRSGLMTWATNELVGWTHQLHNRLGNVALADGSVQGFSNSRLREALQNTGVQTNRLAMP